MRLLAIILLFPFVVSGQQLDFLSARRTDFSVGYQAVVNKCLTTAGCQLPSYSQMVQQNTLYNSLPSGIDVFYCITTDGNLIFASINWITPASFTATQVNSPTFVKNQGLYGNGTNSYLNTNWIPATNGVNYVQNNASIFCYVINNTAGNNSMASMGSVGASTIAIIMPRNVSNMLDFRINSSSSTSDTQPVTVSNGLEMVSRVNATQVRLLLNGALVVTAAENSTGRPTNSIYAEALNNVGTAGFFSNRGVGFLGAGSALNGSEAILFSALETYLSSINTWRNTTLTFSMGGVKFTD